MLNQLFMVTGNENKLREARQILGIEIRQTEVAGLQEIQTVDAGKAVVHKAEEAYMALKKPLIVEDSGLIFKSWNGLPGALVKWFEESVGNEGLLKMLSAYDDRSAVAQCFIGFHNGKEVKVAKGEVSGRIADRLRGDNGFGWDRIFIPDGSGISYAEMAPEEKNAISHRRKAFENLKEILGREE
jgi:XTP/dITP diphosphohydrolase